MCPDEPRSSLTQRTRSYAKRLQRDRHANTQLAASRILDFALEALPTIRSAVDLGCGVGTWLVELARRGIHDLVGLEGPWLDPKLLVMPQEWLVACDLTKDIDLGRRFDLALSLEVAEHLPRERGPGFVGWLTDLADFVLFSAAIPGQGGRGHQGERWQEEWIALFAARGYEALDWIRPRIWKEKEIPPWYRQNTFLFVSKTRKGELRPPSDLPVLDSVVHPELFLRRLERAATLRGILRRWRRKLWLKRQPVK